MSLKKYNAKRDFDKTKEPRGKIKNNNKTLIFVVQHHIARKDHYDLRLEHKGVLMSFAVPKGPSYNPRDKRLAIKVEDHPYSYKNFEGIIPDGEYGGGTVQIFDYGKYEMLNFSSNLLKFKLYGKRLKGLWSLVKIKDDNWLLIKDQDEYQLFKKIDEFKTSVKSGLTIDEIKNKKEEIELTNPDKIIFKNPKVTKEDIYLYYKAVAKKMVHFLENRLISTIRLPEGALGTPFFMKHFENSAKYLGEKKIKGSKYYYIKNIKGILKEVQMNSFEFHMWGCKASDINHADILVFDLDPDEKLSLDKLREGVRDLKRILDQCHMDSFLKTSGGKGYHVVVPLKRRITWTKARSITRNIAKLMEMTYPDKYTSNMKKVKRKEKIFIDWVRNTKGATSVAPYSLRLRLKPTVSMPIKWSDLDKIKPDEIDIKTALTFLKRKDPWEDF